MFSWLKKHFIPHEGNSHRPHFLHLKNIRNLVVLVLFVELILFVLPRVTILTYDKTNNLAAVLPAVLEGLANQNRETVSLPELEENELLNQAAELKAQDMASKSYFAHNSPEGKTPWYWFDEVGYKYAYAGENLAVNFTDSKDVVDAWMDSPTHRANILKGSYTQVGTALASGQFEGRQAVFVVQLYASPKVVEVAVDNTIVVPTNNSSDASVASTPIAEEVNNVQEGSVLGESVDQAEIVTPTAPTFMQKVLASPHQTTNKVLLGILLLVCLALVLNLSIKFKAQHSDLIRNGLLLVILILLVLLANNYLSSNKILIGSGHNSSFVSTTSVN